MKARGMTTILCLASPVLLCVVADPARNVKADFIFGTPTNLGSEVNSSGFDAAPCISPDGLEVYFESERSGGYGGSDIWVTARTSAADPWREPVNLGPMVNSTAGDYAPEISPDGLSLYCQSERAGGYGSSDIWMATRASPSESWGRPVNLGPIVNTSASEGHPSLSADSLTLFFSGSYLTASRPGGLGNSDIWMTTRASVSEPWGEPVNLGSTINSASKEAEPSISADGLALFFGSDRPGSRGSWDIWMTTRSGHSGPWTVPVNLGPIINDTSVNPTPDISHDGSCLYFMSNRLGGFGDFDMWQVPIFPRVDFDGNGFVDIADLVMLIEHWGQDEPSVDIGPMPWGNGVVDAADLEVLVRHWGQEAYDPTLIARWTLDEAAGSVAADSIGTHDGTLVGNPTWQPTGGKLGGALLFDGIDDRVTTESVRDPSQGPFSIFAWVKGGAPGQVIISQTDGANWLMADISQGLLMTELRSAGRLSRILCSGTVITDGNWHRVGLVWDGSNRILYVDDVEVATDAQANLSGTYAGLYLGAGSRLESGSFWTGLIDDIRIYNRAVNP